MRVSRYSIRCGTLLAVFGLLLAIPCAAACSTHGRLPSDQPGSTTPESNAEIKNESELTEDLAHTPPPRSGDSEPGQRDGTVQDDGESVRIQKSLKIAEGELDAQMQEIISLYRRLHIELDDQGRSALIVELFKDSRRELRLLGFDLADRDLSATTTLSDDVGLIVRTMLSDPEALIRAKAARLISRLVPPDAMIVLSESLAAEEDPIAAEPMLLGLARWPNPDAKKDVLRWFLRDDAPIAAACSSAWAMEREGLWDSEIDHPLILRRLRSIEPASLPEDGMKLLAKLGDADDLRTLIGLLSHPDSNVQRWAATSLVETARAVDVLIQAASEDSSLLRLAGESLIQHRATPEGMRLLARLPQDDQPLREQLILNMGEAIEPDQLGESVKLAELEPSISIRVLNRLLNLDAPRSARSSKGIILLGQLELDAGRPNRTLEAVLALKDSPLDPVDQSIVDALHANALILLGRFDEAYSISKEPQFWYEIIRRNPDKAFRQRAASYILLQVAEELDEPTRSALESFAQTPSDEEPEDNSDTVQDDG